MHDYPLLLHNPYSAKDNELIISKADDPQQRLASCMDGQHCDDDLVTHFERSYEDLLALFPEHKILHVYATG